MMYSGGTFLERFAEGWARGEMRDLLGRVPRTAMRHKDGALEEVPLDAILPGDSLLIRQGDVAPVNGTLASDRAVMDQSALTGEAMPVRLALGDAVMSGATNVGEAFDLTATHLADQSTYAGIVRLVEAAQASKAPMSRLADRYALLFLAVTVVVAVAAWWFTGDPGGGGAGGGHALPADSGRAGGVGRWHVARGEIRRADQGGLSAGGAGAGPHADP